MDHYKYGRKIKKTFLSAFESGSMMKWNILKQFQILLSVVPSQSSESICRFDDSFIRSSKQTRCKGSFILISNSHFLQFYQTRVFWISVNVGPEQGQVQCIYLSDHGWPLYQVPFDSSSIKMLLTYYEQRYLDIRTLILFAILVSNKRRRKINI